MPSESRNSLPQTALIRRQLLITAAAVLPVLVILYGWIPYTYSHLQFGSELVSVAQALWAMWNSFPDYQHGMVVPFLAGFIVYTQRNKLMSLPIRGWWPGLFLVIATLMLYWAGRRVDNQYVGFFSLQILLATLVLWLLGWRWLQALAFPLAFLIFTWPMPFLDNLVTFPLRMMMSNFAVGTLNLIGIATIQNGTGILSAENPAVHLSAGELFRVDVADPCSGIRSLFALMMISALYGYFTLKKTWQRGVLFLCSVPLAVAGNLIRILLLTLGIITMGAPTAIGTLEHPSLFHQGAGYVVFLVALAGMLAVSKLLSMNRKALLRNVKTMTDAAKARPPITAPDAAADIY